MIETHKEGKFSWEAEIETLRQQLAEIRESYDTQATETKEAWARNAGLLEQLAASQAREQQLREALEDANDFVERYSNRWDGINGKHPYTVVESSRQALATPTGTTALEAFVTEAGEVMRERCADETSKRHEFGAFNAIRTLPSVTMEDLQ